MDSKYKAEIDKITKTEGVTGIVCADNTGLLLSASGVGSEEHAGAISSIASLASKIYPEKPAPVICIEGEQTNLLIQNQERVVLGIFKQKV